ncbi:MAG TPA: hypothetical protein VFW00_07200 [Rhodocyclaceae bacterium]|nr:hypothetical protein [Rhodocyclaceae bacterium]
MTTEVSVLRAYDQPNGYEQRLPYLAILTITHLSDTAVYLHKAVGKIDRETWNRAMEMLAAKGVRTVQYERHGRMKTINI